MVSVRSSLLALASLAVAVSATQSLSLKITGPAAVDGVDNLNVIATVTNTGDETLKILNDPRGPLSTRPTDTFSITSASGAQPAFSGIKLKYVPKTAIAAGAFTILAPGESVQVKHALGHAYDFSHSGAGTYDIHAGNTFLIVNEDDTVATILADSQAHTAKVAGKLAEVRPAPIVKRAQYIGCSASQQSDLTSAVSAAQSYASSTLSYTRSHLPSTPRFTTWFGTVDPSLRHPIVQQHFASLNSNTFSAFTYDCNCIDPAIHAYVYPDNFGYIHLCGAFWRSPTTGTDSKAGTIIYASSHFTRNGGLEDFGRTQPDAKLLAQLNSWWAIFNAASHEYYAENNPALS